MRLEVEQGIAMCSEVPSSSMCPVPQFWKCWDLLQLHVVTEEPRSRREDP